MHIDTHAYIHTYMDTIAWCMHILANTHVHVNAHSTHNDIAHTMTYAETILNNNNYFLHQIKKGVWKNARRSRVAATEWHTIILITLSIVPSFSILFFRNIVRRHNGLHFHFNNFSLSDGPPLTSWHYLKVTLEVDHNGPQFHFNNFRLLEGPPHTSWHYLKVKLEVNHNAHLQEKVMWFDSNNFPEPKRNIQIL